MSIMQISLVVAMSRNHVIGYQNQLPWHIPGELKHFKALTMGKPIVMGRKTFESIGRVLPGRENIVLTRDRTFLHPDVRIELSLDDFINHLDPKVEYMIIGGVEIYRYFLPLASTIYMTWIDKDYHGDTFFPKWSSSDWVLVREEKHEIKSPEPIEYYYRTYRCARIFD